jgi:hypothetical protein
MPRSCQKLPTKAIGKMWLSGLRGHGTAFFWAGSGLDRQYSTRWVRARSAIRCPLAYAVQLTLPVCQRCFWAGAGLAGKRGLS